MIDLSQVSLALRGATVRSLLVIDEFGKGKQVSLQSFPDVQLRSRDDGHRHEPARWSWLVGRIDSDTRKTRSRLPENGMYLQDDESERNVSERGPRRSS